MAKIKVIQIAVAASSDGAGGSDSYAEYLDDQGRVWFQTGKFVYPEGSISESEKFWQTEWQQVDLPEEPQS